MQPLAAKAPDARKVIGLLTLYQKLSETTVLEINKNVPQW